MLVLEYQCVQCTLHSSINVYNARCTGWVRMLTASLPLCLSISVLLCLPLCDLPSLSRRCLSLLSISDASFLSILSVITVLFCPLCPLYPFGSFSLSVLSSLSSLLSLTFPGSVPVSNVHPLGRIDRRPRQLIFRPLKNLLRLRQRLPSRACPHRRSPAPTAGGFTAAGDAPAAVPAVPPPPCRRCAWAGYLVARLWNSLGSFPLNWARILGIVGIFDALTTW